MMSKKLTIMLFLFLTALPVLFAQTNPVEKGLAAITKEAVQGQLEMLSSDWMEGRETATRGEFIAGDYIASMFKIWGVKPGGDEVMPAMGRRPSGAQPGQQPRVQGIKTYFQNIPFLEAEPGSGEQSMALIIKEGNSEKKYYFSGSDFSISGSSVGTEFTAPVVFVGYGFKNEELGYDDFKGIDVKGKIIIRVSGVPGQDNPESEIYKKLNLGDIRTRMALSRDKNGIAEKLGALGVIEIQAAGSALGGRRGGAQYSNYPLRFVTPIYEGDKPMVTSQHRLSLPEDSLRTGVITLNLGQKVIAELLKNSGINAEEFVKNPKSKMLGKEIKGKSIYVKSVSKYKTVLGRNVVGVIEGENPNEVIVIGGHYDHMGMYNGYIWNGADDNASGTVGVMTIAKAIMATGVKPKRTIVFAAWTGEEKGLLGSRYYAEKYKPIQNLKLNLNYDMISRNSPNDTAGVMLSIQYSEKYPILKEVVEKNNLKYNIGLKTNLRASLRPSGGSDFQSFSAKDVPVYGFMSGMPAEYHQANDHVEKVEFDKMTKIIKLGFLAIWELANIDKIEAVK